MDDTKTAPNINDVLSAEMEHSAAGVPWSRLQKIERVQKLTEYSARHAETEGLGDSGRDELARYLRNALDQRRIHRAKDVEYNKDTGEILSIPGLKYHPATGRFTLRREEPDKRTVRKKNSPKGSKPS